MEEKHLLAISLVCSLLGLGGLFVLGEYGKVEPVVIAEVMGKPLDASVVVEGFASQVFVRQGTTFFQLSDETGMIPVVAFETVQLGKGVRVRVEGKVTQYKGKREVVAVVIEKKI